MGRKKSSANDIPPDQDPVVPETVSSLHQHITEHAPSYLVEYAKSGRADCKKCNLKIEKNALRIGVILEGNWGLFTRWQHLNCTVFHPSLVNPNLIDGFIQISNEDQDSIRLRIEESKNEIDDDMVALNPDDMVRKIWNQPIEPCSDLLMPLLPYQKEGLGWMLNQELTNIHGGILADEMGMGKTIQAVSLILQNRPISSHSEWRESNINHGVDPEFPKAGTLVVLPTIAIRQWQMEIARFTREGSLNVIVYHGADRDLDITSLQRADIVITSYKVLEIEYRKATAGTKVECKLCGKKFYPEKLRVHRKYFCGEFAQKTEAQSKTERKTDRTKPPKSLPSAYKSDSETFIEDSESSDEELKNKRNKSKMSKTKRSSNKKNKSLSDTEDEVQNKFKSNKKSRPSISSKSKKKYDSSDEDFYENSSDTSKEFTKKRKISKASKKKMSKKPLESDDEYGDNYDDEDEEGGANFKKGKTFVNLLSQKEEEILEKEIQAAIKAHEKIMKKANAPQSILHKVSWFRIILDEAHLIKDRSTSTAKAVFNLISLNKWCLTGTPLQNRVGELYSLIRFLRVDPHAYYLCKSKGCGCKSLHYRFTKSMCDDCGHSVTQHFCYFNRHILNPIQRSGFVGDGRKALLKLKSEVLDEVLLRRTKATRAEDIQLPMRIVRVRQEKLDEKEEDFYSALYTRSQAQFNTYLVNGTVLNNYAHIFDILIRLRQAVNHPYLVIYSESQGNIASNSFLNGTEINSTSKDITIDSSECSLCHDPIEDPVISACGHSFCRVCITDFLESIQQDSKSLSSSKCPQCNESLTLIFEPQIAQSTSVWDENKRRRKSILDRIDLTLFQTSTKMEALMEELYIMNSQDSGAKAIVFSQFVNMLDLLEYRIQRGGIGCLKLQGSMTLEQRDKTIRSFKEDPDMKVLLISLKAGGVALNLTNASFIFLMDPWWNPAAEMQAIDRTHRIGQFKPIHATRFIIENTIEERILKLQEKKKLVFDGTVGGDTTSMTKLTVDDMRFLFQ